jgi:uncharacterized membrane protein
MKNSSLVTLLFVLLATTMSGCELVGDILEFGFWAGVIIVVVIILIIVGIFRALRR